jgi:hypothetical protein
MEEEMAYNVALVHNTEGDKRRKMSFQEQVRTVRSKLLYWLKTHPNDDETKAAAKKFRMPTELKKKLWGPLGFHTKNAAEGIFQVASWPDVMYNILLDIWEGNVENVKITSISPLRCLQGIKWSYRLELLQKVQRGELTLKEMEDKAEKAKAISRVKQAMMIGFGLKTWEEVVEVYPTLSSELMLESWADKFKKKNAVWKKNWPTAFKQLIENAQLMKTNKSLDLSQQDENVWSFNFNSCAYRLINKDFEMVESLAFNFVDASLVICDPPYGGQLIKTQDQYNKEDESDDWDEGHYNRFFTFVNHYIKTPNLAVVMFTPVEKVGMVVKVAEE